MEAQLTVASERDTSEEFVDVCGADELWVGELDEFIVGHTKVLLINVEGEYRAYQSQCPHQAVDLIDGPLDGYTLSCPGHNWVFDLTTGGGINPKKACLISYPVEIRDGRVHVCVSTNVVEPAATANTAAVQQG